MIPLMLFEEGGIWIIIIMVQVQMRSNPIPSIQEIQEITSGGVTSISASLAS